jgi:hypothetical protein
MFTKLIIIQPVTTGTGVLKKSSLKKELSRFFHEPSSLQMQGVSHESVIFYRE